VSWDPFAAGEVGWQLQAEVMAFFVIVQVGEMAMFHLVGMVAGVMGLDDFVSLVEIGLTIFMLVRAVVCLRVVQLVVGPMMINVAIRFDSARYHHD
jgi:hypothetical protein